MIEDGKNRLLTRKEVERQYGIKKRWLEMAAHRGYGPSMIKLSKRKVLYSREAIEQYLKEKTVHNE